MSLPDPLKTGAADPVGIRISLRLPEREMLNDPAPVPIMKTLSLPDTLKPEKVEPSEKVSVLREPEMCGV